MQIFKTERLQCLRNAHTSNKCHAQMQLHAHMAMSMHTGASQALAGLGDHMCHV